MSDLWGPALANIETTVARAERRAYVNRRICALRKQRDQIHTEIEELIAEWDRLMR